jgi:hypothetical protein
MFVVKTLLLTLLAFVWMISARAGEAAQTPNELLKAVRAELPKGWSASYDKKDLCLKISRDEAVGSKSAQPNAPPD